MILNGTGNNQIFNSYIEAGSSSALSIGAGATLSCTSSTIDSTNTNAITGAGTLQYAGLAFSNTSSTINTTTQTVLNVGPSGTYGSSNSGLANVLTVKNSSNTATSSAQMAVSVAGSTAADPTTLWSTTTTNWIAGSDNSVTSPTADPFVISQGTALGTNNVMSIATSGEINYPLQPAFSAYLDTTVSNVTGTGTSFTLGTTTALTEIFDQNSDFATSGTFTAPVTGRYLLSVTWRISGIVASTNGNINIVTSNRSYSAMTQNPLNVQSSGSGWKPSSVVFADMDAADTATFTMSASGEAGDVIDVIGAANPTTFCYGYLVC